MGMKKGVRKRGIVRACKRASKQAMKVINKGKTRENVHRSAQGRNSDNITGVQVVMYPNSSYWLSTGRTCIQPSFKNDARFTLANRKLANINLKS